MSNENWNLRLSYNLSSTYSRSTLILRSNETTETIHTNVRLQTLHQLSSSFDRELWESRQLSYKHLSTDSPSTLIFVWPRAMRVKTNFIQTFVYRLSINSHLRLTTRYESQDNSHTNFRLATPDQSNQGFNFIGVVNKTFHKTFTTTPLPCQNPSVQKLTRPTTE